MFDGVPRTKQQIDSTSGGMGGEARKEANKSKVYHGLLKEPEINIRFEEDEEEKEGDEASKPKVPETKFLFVHLFVLRITCRWLMTWFRCS